MTETNVAQAADAFVRTDDHVRQTLEFIKDPQTREVVRCTIRLAYAEGILYGSEDILQRQRAALARLAEPPIVGG